jgi:hypothetical protein
MNIYQFIFNFSILNLVNNEKRNLQQQWKIRSQWWKGKGEPMKRTKTPIVTKKKEEMLSASINL